VLGWFILALKNGTVAQHLAPHPARNPELRTPELQVPVLPDLDDIFSPAVIADPHAWYARLREHDPIHWNERYQVWFITRYDDVVWMIRNHELFSSAVIKNDPRPPYPPVDSADFPLFGPVRKFRSEMLVEQDRPEHLAHRKVMRGFFTPKAMEAWRPFIRNAVTELLDQVQPRGRMDVLPDLAAPLPVRIIVEMMGVPPEDREKLRELADKLLYLNRGEPHRLRPLTEGIEGLLEYVTPKVNERLQHPRDDFISVLAGGERQGTLTRHQVLVNTALLLFAGHETTMNLICNGTLAFIRHPEQWAQLRRNPAGMAESATEETLRYDPPVKTTQRIAAQDVERHGKLFRKDGLRRRHPPLPGRESGANRGSGSISSHGRAVSGAALGDRSPGVPAQRAIQVAESAAGHLGIVGA
jgi:cytochrome P450